MWCHLLMHRYFSSTYYGYQLGAWLEDQEDIYLPHLQRIMRSGGFHMHLALAADLEQFRANPADSIERRINLYMFMRMHNYTYCCNTAWLEDLFSCCLNASLFFVCIYMCVCVCVCVCVLLLSIPMHGRCSMYFLYPLPIAFSWLVRRVLVFLSLFLLHINSRILSAWYRSYMVDTSFTLLACSCLLPHSWNNITCFMQ